MQVASNLSPTMDAAIREQLITQHYPMARAIACRIHQGLPQSVDLDDLISAGVEGLIEAVDRYDPTRSVSLKSYARHRIHGAVVDALRAVDWVPRSVRRKADRIKRATVRVRELHDGEATREQVAAQLEVPLGKYDAMVKDSEIRPLLSLDAPMGDDNATPLVEQVSQTEDFLAQWQREELKDAIIAAIDRLPERERTAIALYYLHELSLKEVGKVLGVTESRACQLCGQGIRRLRKRLRHHVA